MPKIGRQQLDVKWTLLDRVVAAVSPAAGLERWKSRTQLAASGAEGGYDASRRRGRATKRWRPGDASADADTLLDLPDLRGASRDLVRNAPIATGALATNVTNVVGPGLRLIASIDHETLGLTQEQADALEREQEREFALFWKSCDLTGVQHGDELAALAHRSRKESGDSFIIRRYRERPGDVYGTRLQLLEADRVSNPARAADTDTISGGVEVDGDGMPVAYHISNKHPGALRLTALTWERVRARDDQGRKLIIHLFERLRPEMTRAAPWLAPVIELLKTAKGYTDDEATAAATQALYTVFIQSTVDEDSQPIAGETDETLDANEVKLGAGAVVGLAPGETATFPNVSRPNPQFDPFMTSILRQLGVALELPYELLIKHFTASYTASKAAIQMAFQTFMKERAIIARQLYQVAYEWMMEEAVAMGRLSRPGFFADPRIRMAYCAAEWRGPPPPSLNPYQEAQADDLDVKNGFKTGEQVCADRTGGEIEKKINQRGKEVALMQEADIVPASPQPAANAGATSADTTSGNDAEDETQKNKGAAA